MTVNKQNTKMLLAHFEDHMEEMHEEIDGCRAREERHLAKLMECEHAMRKMYKHPVEVWGKAIALILVGFAIGVVLMRVIH